ncbi:MAG TPA: nuclear transport factor 2 family protein [Bryobacteraceae bacterium]|nr:nuclear transport factor 2 family protein [Bryobacteraceae bacterium]
MGSNLKLAESFYAAMGRGDIPFVVGLMHPEVTWNEAEGFVYADRNPYVGPDAVLAGVFARIGAEWDGFSAVTSEFVDGGETVVVFGRYRGTYKATGAKVDAQFVHTFKFRDGKIAHFQQHTDTAQFQNAVHLRAKA